MTTRQEKVSLNIPRFRATGGKHRMKNILTSQTEGKQSFKLQNRKIKSKQC